MKAETETSIIEAVRSWKEQNAGKHGFDIDRIISDARKRESESAETLLSPKVAKPAEHAPRNVDR